jgi:hypothetical protein
MTVPAGEIGTRFMTASVFGAALSRRQFLRRSAIAVGGLAGVELLQSGVARAAGADPNPIPGGLGASGSPVPSNPLVHVLPPAIGFEMPTITDFSGIVAAAEIQGRARGSDGSEYSFDTDMRFFQGAYVGMDGQPHQGTFGFI